MSNLHLGLESWIFSDYFISIENQLCRQLQILKKMKISPKFEARKISFHRLSFNLISNEMFIASPFFFCSAQGPAYDRSEREKLPLRLKSFL